MASNENMHLRVSKEFKEQTKEQASKYGLSASTYIRMLVTRDSNEEVKLLDGLISGEFASVTFKGYHEITGKPIFNVTHNI
jgi:endonuclease V-like protein UPF0215 family